MLVDIADTNTLGYGANETKQISTDRSQASHPGAVSVCEQAILGERALYIPRYILGEFYNFMESLGRRETAQTFHRALEESDTVFVSTVDLSAHREYQQTVAIRRRQPETTAIAEALDMQAKDAPIIAAAHRLPEFVAEYDPPTHDDFNIPQAYEEYQLLNALQEVGVNSISTRILTCEGNFVGTNPFNKVEVCHPNNVT